MPTRMEGNMRLLLATGCMACSLLLMLPLNSLGQDQTGPHVDCAARWFQRPIPVPTPKYQSRMISENLDPSAAGPLGTGHGDQCARSCVPGPAVLEPQNIDVCQDEEINLHFQILGVTDRGSLITRGDEITQHRGDVDWGDGKWTDLKTAQGFQSRDDCCEWNVKHIYRQASNVGYAPSACYTQDFKNADNPPGGCSARCGGVQAAKVIVHLKNSPECATGKYEPKKAARVLDNFPKVGAGASGGR
jgi:hypothetical protein